LDLKDADNLKSDLLIDPFEQEYLKECTLMADQVISKEEVEDRLF
jgi:hypothetical protein